MSSASRKWLPEEDRLLMLRIEPFLRRGEKPSDWKKIAEGVPGRESKQCRLRWTNQLNPKVKSSRELFTEWEDAVIVLKHMEVQNRWARIRDLLPGRTDNGIKNHWHAALRRGMNDGSIHRVNRFLKQGLTLPEVLALRRDTAGSHSEGHSESEAFALRTSQLAQHPGLIELAGAACVESARARRPCRPRARPRDAVASHRQGMDDSDEGAAADEPVAADATPEDVMPEDAVPEDAAPKDMALDDEAPAAEEEGAAAVEGAEGEEPGAPAATEAKAELELHPSAVSWRSVSPEDVPRAGDAALPPAASPAAGLRTLKGSPEAVAAAAAALQGVAGPGERWVASGCGATIEALSFVHPSPAAAPPPAADAAPAARGNNSNIVPLTGSRSGRVMQFDPERGCWASVTLRNKAAPAAVPGGPGRDSFCCVLAEG